MTQDKVRIVVVVKRGLVEQVCGEGNVEVVLLDWDNEPLDRATIFPVTPETYLTDEAAELVREARGTASLPEVPEEYCEAIRYHFGKMVTVEQAAPFYRTGYTPEAAAHELFRSWSV